MEVVGYTHEELAMMVKAEMEKLGKILKEPTK